MQHRTLLLAHIITLGLCLSTYVALPVLFKYLPFMSPDTTASAKPGATQQLAAGTPVHERHTRRSYAS